MRISWLVPVLLVACSGKETGTPPDFWADADTDTDSDTDADADTDTTTTTDTTITDGELLQDPVRPGDVGEDYGTDGMCATAPGSAAWVLAGLAAAVGVGRRKRG